MIETLELSFSANNLKRFFYRLHSKYSDKGRSEMSSLSNVSLGWSFSMLCPDIPLIYSSPICCEDVPEWARTEDSDKSWMFVNKCVHVRTRPLHPAICAMTSPNITYAAPPLEAGTLRQWIFITPGGFTLTRKTSVPSGLTYCWILTWCGYYYSLGSVHHSLVIELQTEISQSRR